MRKIIVGSRRSKLALTQSKWVIAQLEALGLPFEFELKEIEQQMIDKEIDMAIHSMKDMPAELPEGLVICCIPFREDHLDALISRNGEGLKELPQGAKVGTSSLRRSAQLLKVRPDLLP